MEVTLMNCDKCRGTNDVAELTIPVTGGYDKINLCVDCRLKLFTKDPVKAGRPSLGITKKVSLTLPEEEWQWFDEQAKGNRSQFLRHLVWEAQSSENEWSNNACLGYAILGAKKLGYNDEQIKELVKAMYGEFDWKSIEEAKDTYNKSSY